MSLGLTTTTRATCGSTIRAISHAFPVTSSATRSSGPKLCANNSSCSGLVSTRPADRTSPPSAIATSQNSRCTSNPTALTTPHPPSLARRTGDAVGKRHRRIRAQSATGQVAGAATENPGLKRPSSKNRPAQHAFSQEPPSRSPDPNPPSPRTAALGAIFMPRRPSVSPSRDQRSCFARAKPRQPSGRPHAWTSRPKQARDQQRSGYRSRKESGRGSVPLAARSGPPAWRVVMPVTVRKQDK